MGNKINATNTGDVSQTNKTTNIKIGSTIIIIGILAVALFFGKGMFDSSSKKIIGTWVSEKGYTYVFQENGQYSHDGGWFGTYSVDGDKLTLCPVLNDPEIYRISVTSDSLTIYKHDGDVYRELKKLE